MTIREKLVKEYGNFLSYCENPPEDYPEKEFEDISNTTYPIHITKMEVATLKDLGIEVIRQMPASVVKKTISTPTASKYVITLEMPDKGSVRRDNTKNAGYIVYRLVMLAIQIARKGDYEKAVTRAEFSEFVRKIISLEYPHADQLEGQETLFEEEAPPELPKASARSVAIERGALMSLSGHLRAFSSDGLKDALTSATLSVIPSKYNIQNAFDDSGKLITLAVDETALVKADAIQTAVGMAILQAVYLSPIGESQSIDIYVPAFLEEMHIDPRPYSTKRSAEKVDMAELRYQKMLDLISPYDRFVGTLPNGDHYRWLFFEKWDKASEVMTIRAPYFFRARELNQGYEIEEEKKKQLTMTLLLSSAGSEPNYAAVELAVRILIGLERRGKRGDYLTYSAPQPKKLKQTVTKTDSSGNRTTTTTVFDTKDQTEAPQEPNKSKKVTYTVKYSSLIADCPQVAAALSATENEKDENGNLKPNRAQAYNSKLKQIFEAAFRIIMEKSDAPIKYADFTIPTIEKKSKNGTITVYEVPTKSTLSRNLVITHKGKSPNYTQI